MITPCHAMLLPSAIKFEPEQAYNGPVDRFVITHDPAKVPTVVASESDSWTGPLNIKLSPVQKGVCILSQGGGLKGAPGFWASEKNSISEFAR